MAPPKEPQGVDSDRDASSDEDFNPEANDATVASSSSDSDSETEAAAAPKAKSTPSKQKNSRKRKHVDFKADEAIELDSGDEATIRERQKKRKKAASAKKKGKKRKAGDDDDIILSEDDEGGEGGLIKTRAQRRTEKEERVPLATRELNTTVDVDAIWARLSALPLGRPPTPPPENETEEKGKGLGVEEYIMIKRRTRYAGQLMVEEKRVLKDSAEAKLYLEELEAEKGKKGTRADLEDEQEKENEDEETQQEAEAETEIRLQRPLKRPSRFEPNPVGEVKGLPAHLQLRWPRYPLATSAHQSAQDLKGLMQPPPLPGKATDPAATKLNTVQKSRQDWASHVDQEGISTELDEYNKSKASYLGREEFLNRTEGRMEDERRNARMAGMQKPTVRYGDD
jgi:hypothetical protein